MRGNIIETLGGSSGRPIIEGKIVGGGALSWTLAGLGNLFIP